MRERAGNTPPYVEDSIDTEELTEILNENEPEIESDKNPNEAW